MKKSAFTLVELMVAMAIIGVLLGLAIFGVSAAQKAQRNTERKAAIQDLNLGIQQYIDSYGTAPIRIYFGTVSACIGDTTITCTNGKLVPLKGAAVPASPGEVTGSLSAGTMTPNNTRYGFTAVCTGGYSLATCLEGNTTPFDVGTCTTPVAYTCPPV